MSDSRVFEFTSGKLSFKSVEGTKGKEYFVEGHITSGDLDLVNDIVTKACMVDMSEQFNERTIKMDFEHEAYRGKSKLESQINKTRIPLGKAVDRTMDDKGLKVKWKMNPTWKKFDEKGNVVMTFKDIWDNVEKGFYDAFSIAYVVKKSKNKMVNGTKAQLLEKVGLLNVALTGNPINPGASMTAVMAKSLEWLKGNKTKAYDKDGAHAHTEDNPIGEHSHPEIEKAISDIYNTIDRRIDYVHERIDDLNNSATDEPEQMLKKGKKNLKGDIVADDTKKKDEGKEEEASDKTEEKSQEQEQSPEMIEVKAALKDMSEVMTKDLKTVKDELKELKDKVEAQDKILSKAQHKALGAANKEEKEETSAPKVKSALGMIG